MDAYIYNADIYCEDCTNAICKELDDDDVEDTGDSNDYPQGPYPDGGGEADCPHHCGNCGLFLKNPLTSDGYQYVKDAISAFAHGYGDEATIEEWMNYYIGD